VIFQVEDKKFEDKIAALLKRDPRRESVFLRS
jgi:hypothetical protein